MAVFNALVPLVTCDWAETRLCWFLATSVCCAAWAVLSASCADATCACADARLAPFLAWSDFSAACAEFSAFWALVMLACAFANDCWVCAEVRSCCACDVATLPLLALGLDLA